MPTAIRRLHVPLVTTKHVPACRARRAAYSAAEFYGHAASFAFFDARACSRRDEHGGDAFLLGTMWLRKHGRLLTDPCATTALIEGYATNLESMSPISPPARRSRFERLLSLTKNPYGDTCRMFPKQTGRVAASSDATPPHGWSSWRGAAAGAMGR